MVHRESTIAPRVNHYCFSREALLLCPTTSRMRQHVSSDGTKLGIEESPPEPQKKLRVKRADERKKEVEVEPE